MLNTLFSPSGRLGPQAFFKGMMVLAIVSAIISIVPMFAYKLGSVLQMVLILFLVPLFFMLIKRSRDAGKSGWMSIVWFILFVVIWIVVSMIVSMVFPTTAQDEMKVAMEAAMLDGGGLSAMVEMTEEFGERVAKEAALPSAISGLLGTALAAFLINKLNKRDGDNQHGPA